MVDVLDLYGLCRCHYTSVYCGGHLADRLFYPLSLYDSLKRLQIIYKFGKHILHLGDVIDA